jgi:hypothetical protein
MAVADNRQRLMPCPEDLTPKRCKQLAYPEAHVLTDPVEPDLAGEVCNFYSNFGKTGHIFKIWSFWLTQVYGADLLIHFQCI